MAGETITHSVLEQIRVTRYVNAAAYVVLLYDHVLTFGNEVRLIWPAKFSAPKILFLFIRYMVPVALTIYTVQLAGLTSISLSDTVCRWWMGFAAFAGWATVATSNFLILLRLWVIWDRNRKLMIYTGLCYVVAEMGGIACASLLVWQMTPRLIWQHELQMCAFNTAKAPPVSILWIPGICFEIVMFSVTWWNALNQPRSSNVALAATMYFDGFIFFILLLGLRIANTALAFAAPVSKACVQPHLSHAIAQQGLLFVAMFPVWCATTTVTCRLIIKLRQVTEDQRTSSEDSSEVGEDSSSMVTARGEYDELVRSGVNVEMLRSVGPSTPIRASGWP
ncbi:hypothetical protein FB45DRAFT_1051613 [Roridomyces roridus]|uniref:DUF6533 domain-containing protein n=1 Tax=Roridomyces roridus TaxID=1738132 RepID=A0AAD7CEP3_9AGAR|nr:hypothetical protein FB45DRAFT_1051613 [Roridomyces roridus]